MDRGLSRSNSARATPRQVVTQDSRESRITATYVDVIRVAVF